MPSGLQTNLVTGEIFAAYGSANFTTVPGPKHFLKSLHLVPATTSTSSTLQWLAAYGAGGSQGLIAQINGGQAGGVYTTGNYFFRFGHAISSRTCQRGVDRNRLLPATIGLRRRRKGPAHQA